MDQRPAIVEEKSRIGDGEIDLVMGRPRTGALVSVVERRSCDTVLGKVPSKQAEHGAAVSIGLLAAHKGHTRRLRPITARSLPTMPRSARRWTRPSILPIPTMLGSADEGENTNGLIRPYVPKGTACGYAVGGTDTPHHGSAQSPTAKGLGISNAT